MLVHKRRGGRRRAAAVVETAMVFLPLVVLMFGIFEYGRLLMAWNLLNNAAREGCRWALVNNTDPTISTDVQTIVNNYMAGQTSCFNGAAVTVTVSGTHNGTATAVNNLVAGDMISVSVSGQYQFLNIIPLVKLPASLTLTSSCIMLCEGVT
jgi:Flp pilus assembly protein TadG